MPLLVSEQSHDFVVACYLLPPPVALLLTAASVLIKDNLNTYWDTRM